MNKILSFCLFSLFAATSFAQKKEAFDLITYTAPKAWKKHPAEGAIQFSKEDGAKGTYCMITVFKAVPGVANSKENFDMAWTSLVKETVTVSTSPEMQPAASEEGWEILSGYAPFESDGNKGVVVLVTASGFEKMMNVVILTNTDVYEKNITEFLESIKFDKQSAGPNKPARDPVKQEQAGAVVKNDGFTFTTTNFDDGWTSTVQEDWVEVKKGDITVLIHYPKEGTIFPADPGPLTDAAWNILVAPRYSNLRNYKTTYISTYNRPYLGFGNLTENSTGKEVYVLLYRQGETGWLEFIAPDKNRFMQQFKFDPDMVKWDSETELMNPLARMSTYNKFAIGAADFNGTWTSDFTGVQQLYNIYTGNSAGMNIHQSNQTFQFDAGNTYNWSLMVVNGIIGNTKYVNVKSSGKFSVPNNWQISFSDIEGKPKIYDAYFACIKGARLLMMNDAGSPGSGIYQPYGRK
jgi:hypothetical protein